MLKNVFTQDISKMFNVEEIREDGRVLVGRELYEIYEVLPINITTDEPNNVKEIYDIYVSRLRNASNNIKIYITKMPEAFNPEIEVYKRKLLDVEEPALKQAIARYIEYLEDLDKNRDMYSTCYYIILSGDEVGKNFELLLGELKKYGLIIERVTSKEVLERIFKGAAQW